MKTKLLLMAFLAVVFSVGCRPPEGTSKRDARWDIWRLNISVDQADKEVKECIAVLKSVEKNRPELTAQIKDESLAADVRDDLKVQRGLVFQKGQLAVAKLQECTKAMESEIQFCHRQIERAKLDPVADARNFDLVTKAEAKLVTLKASTEAIVKAWQNYTKGQPLPDLN